MLIIDAPSAFWLLWRAVKPFIQEKTAAKIEFVTWSDAPQRYKELLGPTVAGRLVSEGVWLQHCDARTRSTARHVCTRCILDSPAPQAAVRHTCIYLLRSTSYKTRFYSMHRRSREPQQGERSGEAVVDILRARSRRVVVQRVRRAAVRLD